MKRYRTFFIIMILGLWGFQSVHSQSPQLTFRMNNPRILFTGGVNYLQFEIEIKCNQLNMFLDGSTMYLSFNTVGFSETGPLVTFGPHYAELNANFDPKYSKIQTFSTFGGTRRFGIGITSPNAAGQPGGTDYLSEVYTYFHPFVTVRLRINDQTQLAQVFFRQSEMNGVGAYKALGSATPQSWLNPHLYDGKDFTSLYLGRLFNSLNSWTQYGGTVNWATSVNTSIWDTTTTAAIISSPGSMAAALRIHTGAKLKINPGSDLTCTGDFEINGPQGLWIASDATGTGSFIDNGNISYPSGSGGTARVDRYFGQNVWHYWSMPVTTSTAAPFTGLYMRWFEEQMYRFHEIIATGTVLYPMWGYSVYSLGNNATVAVTGALNTGSKITPTLTSTHVDSLGGYDGWNFIGNPYPSSTDWELWTRTGVDPTMYCWNSTGYQTWNAVTHSGTKADKYIRPEQGFFVHVTTDGGTGSVAVANSARTHTSGPYNKKSTGISDKLVLTASANGIDDEAHVVFDNDATANFDPDYDAYKLMGVTQAPNLYSRLPSDIIAAVNWLPWTGSSQIVPMGFNCGLSGVYHITASNLESFSSITQIYLEDLKENITQDIMSYPVYHFNYSAGEDPGRFLIHFSKTTLGLNEPNVDNIQIYTYDDFVYVKHLTTGEIHGTVLIYDLAGQNVFTGKLENHILNKYRTVLSTGFYVVKVQTDREINTSKVFINQK